MNAQSTSQTQNSISGFLVLPLFLAWTVAYFFLASSIHQILWLDRFPVRFEVISYALHLVPFLGLPITLFWLLDRRQRKYRFEFIPNAIPKDEGPPSAFSHIKLKTFASLGIGIVFTAPDSWIENDDQDCFQVVDPVTGSEFAASSYENPGLFLEQWNTLRNEIVEKQMPYLKRIRESYGVRGNHGGGIATEYQGVFPGSGLTRHYLVLSLRSDTIVTSFSITASLEAFSAQESFYRWLLTQLDVYKVEKLEAAGR
jgi:hypothetical protein